MTARARDAYTAILRARFLMMLQYRAAAFAGVGTQVFWGFIKIMVLEAFYRSSDATQPMSMEAVVDYVWLGQAFLALLPWNHDRELETLIRKGDVAYELVRPLDLFWLWYLRALAWRGASASLRCIPLLAFAGLILPLTPLEPWAFRPPESLASGLGFGVAILAALLLSCAITTLVHVSFLWTISGEGMARLMPAVVTVFSGMVVPLPLLPGWAQSVLAVLPFRGLVDTPNRIYTGHIAPVEAVGPLLLTGVWIGVFVWVGRAVLARGTRRVVVQGG